MVTAARRKFLQGRIAESFQSHDLEALRDTLIRMDAGSELVAPPTHDGHLESILKHGRKFSGFRAELVRGRSSACHWNCAVIWSQNRNRLRICVGYALSGDRLWRQHTWLWDVNEDGDGRVVETTTRRKIYFGIELSNAEAARFARAQ